jgi:transketolase
MALENKEMREVYAELLLEYAAKDDRLVIVEADLMKAVKTTIFGQTYPERTINVGVAEANMICVAAGMAAMGKIPFTHTFTPFATRRCCDQVTLSVAYAGLHVKMVGSDPGVTAELNGGTHMSMEDVAIMRNIPNMLIFEPTDGVQLRKAFPQIIDHDGPVYMRLLRLQPVSVFSENDEFALGKAITIREGKDVAIIAYGIMVSEALEAAEILKNEGIDAAVINMHTIKPLDEEAVLKVAKETGAIITAENHSILNALGSAVAEFLAENHPTPMQRVGVRDHFGEVGKREFLMEKYGLKAVDIVVAAKKAIAMKK